MCCTFHLSRVSFTQKCTHVALLYFIELAENIYHNILLLRLPIFPALYCHNGHICNILRYRKVTGFSVDRCVIDILVFGPKCCGIWLSPNQPTLSHALSLLISNTFCDCWTLLCIWVQFYFEGFHLFNQIISLATIKVIQPFFKLFILTNKRDLKIIKHDKLG